jgi:DNA-binding transcriptional LysR family regulator
MDWDRIRIFHLVASSGSLTEAGKKLNVSQSSVSRQIQKLEGSLNTSLFHRHPRGLLLTEQGELLYKTSSKLSEQINSTVARINDSKESVFGELRVTTTTGFGTLWLAPRLKKLYEKHPKIQINLMLEEKLLNLAMREADVAIRLQAPSQADLIQRKLVSVRIKFYATKEYLENHKTPETIEDLSVSNRLICYSPESRQITAGQRWIAPFLARNDFSLLFLNNYYGIFRAVRNGLGVGTLPDYLAKDFPELVQVLPELQSDIVPIYIAYPQELKTSKRVTAFKEFIFDELGTNR